MVVAASHSVAALARTGAFIKVEGIMKSYKFNLVLMQNMQMLVI